MGSKRFYAFCQNIKSGVSRGKFLVGSEQWEELNPLLVQGSGMLPWEFLEGRVIPWQRKDNPMGQKGSLVIGNNCGGAELQTQVWSLGS